MFYNFYLNFNNVSQGVESEKCPSMHEALNNGGPITTNLLSTLADGLAVPTVGVNAYATIAPLIDKMV